MNDESAEELGRQLEKKRQERDRINEELTGLAQRHDARDQEERAAEVADKAAKRTERIDGKPPPQSVSVESVVVKPSMGEIGE